MKRWLAALVVPLLCLPAGFASSRSQRARGAEVFAQSGCAHCHTIRSSGGHKGPDLSGVGRRLTKDQMQHQILNGSKLMPPFAEDLEDSEVADLLAYLRSCRDKKR